VGNRDVVAIYGIMMLAVLLRRGLEMSDNLMAEEVKIDPLRRASPLRTAQQASIKSPSSLQIINRESDVEGSEWHPEVSFRPSYVFSLRRLAFRKAARYAPAAGR
jgi:hypothetical protein